MKSRIVTSSALVMLMLSAVLSGCFGLGGGGSDDEDEWESYVDLGDIEASWPSGTSWPSSSGDV